MADHDHDFGPVVTEEVNEHGAGTGKVEKESRCRICGKSEK